MKKITLFISVAVVLFFVACEKEKRTETVVPLDRSGFSLLNDSKEVREEEESFAVVTVDRLRVRSSYDIHAKTIRYLDQGEIVEVLAKNEERVRINNLEDYWYQIEYNGGIKGWVFGYYLEIYKDYKSAYEASHRYVNSINGEEAVIHERINFEFMERFINNNLLFLSDGKLLEVTDFLNGKAKVLPTASQVVIETYAVDENFVYYIGKNNQSRAKALQSADLYRYNFENNGNDLLIRGVQKCVFDFHAKIAVAADLVSSKRAVQGKEGASWVLKRIDLTKPQETIFAEIEKRGEVGETDDPFYASLIREKGKPIYLELDHDKNIVYFQPPERDQTYLVSLKDGSFIQVELTKKDEIVIDTNRSLKVENCLNDEGDVKYSIMLKDNISGYTKEIIKTADNPINFVTHSYKDLVAVTMLQMNPEIYRGNCYPSFIYLISLSTYSIIPISTSGDSYQPQWRK